jgi:hypothetical protein
MLGPAPGAEGTPEGDPALMPLGPEHCAQCLGQHVRTLHLFIHVHETLNLQINLLPNSEHEASRRAVLRRPRVGARP